MPQAPPRVRSQPGSIWRDCKRCSPVPTSLESSKNSKQMALLAKLRPCGPWRVGPDSGDRLRVGRVLPSDALYSALTRAFIELGELDTWLEATAMHADGAQVRL